MTEIESLEKQFQLIEERRRTTEAERKRLQGNETIVVTDEKFVAIQTRINDLGNAVEASKSLQALVNLPALSEMFVDIAKGYDEAIRSMLLTVAEHNKDARSKEITGLQDRFEQLSDKSTDVLQALNAIVIKLDAFASNLELERKVLLNIEAELNH